MTALNLLDHSPLINNDFTTPHIYVVCSAAYQQGHVHGAWIKADQSPDALQAAIHAMLATSPVPHATKWAIQDQENFGSLRLDENTLLEEITDLAAFMQEHDSDLSSALLEHLGNDTERARELLQNYYYGEYASEKAFIHAFIEETDLTPEQNAFYIDDARLARDLFISDFFSLSVNGNLHVFRHN